MKIALDANILIYAADDGSVWHSQSVAILESLVAGDDAFYLFWPVVLAFLRVSTYPRLFRRPLSLGEAFDAIESLLDHPNVYCPGEFAGFARFLREITVQGAAHGRLVHDAHIVALMKQHEVRTIWTSDRDFRRFDGIRVVNPLV